MSDSSTTERLVKCPHCGKPAVYAASNKFRPFCTERCRMIDLGDWADGAYKIPVNPQEGYDHVDTADVDREQEDSN